MLLKRLAGLSAATLLAGCTFALTASAASAAATLQGEGSTLVAPLADEWAAAWGGQNNVTVTYNSQGSGAGYKAVAQGLVDFGASDAPLSAYSTPPCNGCKQIPWGLSATGISYNLPGLRLKRGKSLHLTPSVVAGIYLGTIKSWGDPRITSLNRGSRIPNLPITPIWRNDASGDSFAFSSELSDVSGSFRSSVGPSTLPSFHVGDGAKGNSGEAALLGQTAGGISYISVAYLLSNNLPAAGIQNRAGNYVVPNLAPIENAAAVFHSVPSNNQLTIVNPPRRAKNAYPISTFTYVMVPASPPQAALLKSFIRYALTGGQKFDARLGFANLPGDVLNASLRTLNSI